MVCSICGRRAACEISQVTHRPWCEACQKRRARCAGCGRVELVRAGTIGAPLCAVCARPDPAFWGGCPRCGHPQPSTRSCTRCNQRQRLQVLLADHDGDDVRVELRGLHDDLLNSDRPSSVLEWLNKPGIAELLRELGSGQRTLSHAGLDELPASKAIEHLRAILVATGTLPARDEQLARLERWIARTLADHHDPEQRELLHRYAVWLLHDPSINPLDRVAGLLVLLYAQTPAALSRLTLEHIPITEHAVHLRLGHEPIALPEPLAGLVADLLTRRSGHATLGNQGTSPWLFPGGRPGQPISAYQLAERLRQLGLHPAQSRTTALFSLAAELPAAVLARMLGIHIKVVAWQQACAGDWTSYAADYSRRTPTPAQHDEPALPPTGND